MNRRPSEDALLHALCRGLPRSAAQLNRLHESDAELVRVPGLDGVLAVTTDLIVEEVRAGLYDDPSLLGRMAVLVNASDLAAVGAEPVGIVLTETLPPDLDDAFRDALQAGIADACRRCGLPVLGGDTNADERIAVGGTALGIVPDGRPLTRSGARPGDRLFATGRLGAGSAFALAKLTGAEPVPEFDPRPRLRAGAMARRHASAAIDTSDGVLAALDVLMRLNGVGVELDASLDRVLDADARLMAARFDLPAWMLLAGPHGEFELLIAVPPGRRDAFLRDAARLGEPPLEIGRVVANEPGRVLIRGAASPVVPAARAGGDPADAGSVPGTVDGAHDLVVDTTAVRAAHEHAGADPLAYVATLHGCAGPVAAPGGGS